MTRSGPLPIWATLVRADNPGPMTLEGTNTWVLQGEGQAVVVDPGPLDGRHLAAVAAYAPVVLIVLTHRHADHAEGAARLAELTGAPVLARDRSLCLGSEPLWEDDKSWGAAGLSLRTLHTPGHTSDSISLLVEGGDGPPAVLTGDTVLGRGTTVVAHPDGRLGDYLTSLDRLAAVARDHAGLVLLPGHGPAGAPAAPVVDAYRAHRRERLTQVRAAVDAGAETAAAVVALVYADVEPHLRPAAELSARAQLDYLRGTP